MTKTRKKGKNLKKRESLARCGHLVCHLPHKAKHQQRESGLCQGAESGLWMPQAAPSLHDCRVLCPGCEVRLFSSPQHLWSEAGWQGRDFSDFSDCIAALKSLCV